MSQSVPHLSQPIGREAGENYGPASPDALSPAPRRPFINALPPAAWTRLGLLFTCLVLIKLTLLFGFAKHVYEKHWRVIPDEPESWVNYLAFFVFVVLGVWSLLLLAAHCRQKGLRTVRAANAVLLCLGFLFIFLTFHTGDKNYIYPILTRILKWNNLVPYLSLDFCFRPPFLAAWLLGYVFVYYVMVRTGRETWALHLTAFLAGAYAVLCLRELHFYRDELLVVDCVGLACLLASRALAFHPLRTTLKALPFTPRFSGVCAEAEDRNRFSGLDDSAETAEAVQAWPNHRTTPLKRGANETSESRLNPFWLLVPFLWAVLYCVLLRSAAPQLGQLDLYFRLLFGGTLLLFAALTLSAVLYGLFRAWIGLAPFFFTAFLLLTNGYYPVARNYNNSLCLALEFPHYFLGEVGLVTVLASFASAYHRAWPKAGFRWLDVANLALITIAVIDLRLSQIMGVRLEWSVLTFGNSPKMMWRMARPYLPSVFLGLAALTLLYFLSLRAAQSWCNRKARPIINSSKDRPSSKSGIVTIWSQLCQSPGLCFAMLSFLLLALVGWAIAEPDKAQGESTLRLAASTPWWSRAVSHTLSPEEFVKKANELGLSFDQVNHVPIIEKPRDLNVLVVFMESSYNKYLSLFGSQYDTQPLLSKYKDRMEIFPNFFSVFASSIHARFATFTSLYPVRDYNDFTLHHVDVKSLFEILHENGYSSSLFYSSFFDFTDFGDFLKGRGIDEMYDANNMPGALGAERVSWGLKEETTLGAIRAQIKKYSQEKRPFFLTYVPAAPHYPYDNIPAQFRKFKKEDMRDFTPVYLNELLYMDWVLASIVDQLKESGLLDQTLVLITNDHGEMLGGESGTIGHGWAFTPELANTPLIVMDPQNRGWHINYTIGSQVDFLPTVIDKLNLRLPTGELYEGHSLYRDDSSKDRQIYLNTCQQFGVLHGYEIQVADHDTEEKGSLASNSSTYIISNDGTKTLFAESPSTAHHPISIRSFDDFQENLLRNYSAYRQSLCNLHNSLVSASGGHTLVVPPSSP